MSYRPLGARLVAYAGGVSLVATAVVIAAALSPEVRAAFSLAERLTLLLFLLAALAVLWGVARCWVYTDADGIHILNGYRRHLIAWDAVVWISLGPAAPWAVLTVAGDETVGILAIQAADGNRARAAVAHIRDLIAQHR